MSAPFQFSLRSLFVTTLFVCAGLALLVAQSAWGLSFAFLLCIVAFGYLVDGRYGAMMSVFVIVLVIAIVGIGILMALALPRV